jgi:hypothetical protein
VGLVLRAYRLITQFFNKEDIGKLYTRRDEMHRQFADLRERFLVRAYKSERGREFASHGFCRRLGTMVRAVDIVYERLPPELEGIPARDTVHDATIAIQSFVSNACGCLDNLAWIWVCEKPVLDDQGKELDPLKVGLGPKCEYVRNSFSKDFVIYLKSRKKWVDNYLKDFRDSLAHRIPLYIPPFMVSHTSVDEYNKLERDSTEALRKHDFKRYDELQAAQKSLGFWRPWMTHSITEESRQVVFHVQLITDYLTIDEFGREMLKELERIPCNP